MSINGKTGVWGGGGGGRGYIRHRKNSTDINLSKNMQLTWC